MTLKYDKLTKTFQTLFTHPLERVARSINLGKTPLGKIVREKRITQFS